MRKHRENCKPEVCMRNQRSVLEIAVMKHKNSCTKKTKYDTD